jgi:hypothetical protein
MYGLHFLRIKPLANDVTVVTKYNPEWHDNIT